MRVTHKISRNGSTAVLGMSLLAGLGVTLVVVALSAGVIQGSSADSGLIGLLIAAGAVLFLIGAIGWFGLTQPHRHFDDINRPMDSGHHGGQTHEGQEASAAETAHDSHH